MGLVGVGWGWVAGRGRATIAARYARVGRGAAVPTGATVQYMIIEHFKDRDAVAVYRRFRDRGRLAPVGLQYVVSWVEISWDRCFQIMECDDTRLIDEWIAQWSDLVKFEVIPVMASSDASALIAPKL